MPIISPGADAVMTSRPAGPVVRRVEALDAYLLAVPPRVQLAVIAITALVMAGTSIGYVPRQYADLSGTPVLRHLQQPETYGPDSLSDMYVSKVILNDVGDMYTKEQLAQTELEARTWSKEETAPYPPLVLLVLAGLHAAGDALGIGLYGTILILAVVFLASSARYFLATRWYLFPLLYLNFSYLGYRFVYVQDDSHLVMLVTILAALWLARRRHPAAHLLMAIAICLKFMPLYYVRQIVRMRPKIAALFVAVLAAGLVLPYFVWDNYLYIYWFTSQRTGQDLPDTLGALAVAAPVTLALWYVEAKRRLDWEDRVGWSLVPFALLVGILTNTARHLLLVLLVPDKRAGRNVAAAVGIGLHTLLPSLLPLGAIVYVTTVLLGVVLWHHLAQVGWEVVRDDLRHPLRTARMMIERPA